MTKEKVIFRREKTSELHEKGSFYFLAAFPEEEANPGMVACLPFHIPVASDRPVFEPFCEVSLDYYYGTKLVRKTELAAKAGLEAVQKYYGAEFTVVEKLTGGRKKS